MINIDFKYFYTSFFLTITFFLFGFFFVFTTMKNLSNERFKNIQVFDIFSLNLKVFNKIEYSFWNLFKKTMRNYKHYLYHDSDKVCIYCILLGYSLPLGELIYNRAIEVSNNNVSNILKRIRPTKEFNKEGICVRCNNFTKISKIKYNKNIYILDQILCDNCLLVNQISFPKYIIKREIGKIK